MQRGQGCCEDGRDSEPPSQSTHPDSESDHENQRGDSRGGEHSGAENETRGRSMSPAPVNRKHSKRPSKREEIDYLKAELENVNKSFDKLRRMMEGRTTPAAAARDEEKYEEYATSGQARGRPTRVL